MKHLIYQLTFLPTQHNIESNNFAQNVNPAYLSNKPHQLKFEIQP